MAVRLGGTDERGNLYVLVSYKHWPENNRVDQFGPDGKLKKRAYCEPFTGGGLAVGQHGTVYVTQTENPTPE